MTSGKLYGIGVPIGNPEYISMKALQVLKEADIIMTANDSSDVHAKSLAYDDLVSMLPEISDKQHIFVDIPRVGTYKELINTNNDTRSVLVDFLNQNMIIVFLANWSASFSYNYNYIHNIVGNKFETEIIPSLSIESICASKLNEILASEGENVYIISSSDDLDFHLKMEGLKIFINMGQKTGELVEKIRKIKYADVRVINAIGSNSEKIYKSLEELPNRLSKSNIIIVKN